MLSVKRRMMSDTMARPFGFEPRAHLPLSGVPLPLRLYVVGDVHGCADQLGKMEQLIMSDAGGEYGAATIVYVGDIVDRGPDTAGVVNRLSAPAAYGPHRLVLLGNHEQMMLKFVTQPHAAARWLDFGGAETLASYGIYRDPRLGWDYSANKWRALLNANIPRHHIDFLRSLPRSVQFGRYFISHAGVDPSKPLSEQSLYDLLWTPSTSGCRVAGVTLVHGHTVVNQPEISPDRIKLDTGAYATGRLTAVCLAPDQAPRILQI